MTTSEVETLAFEMTEKIAEVLKDISELKDISQEERVILRNDLSNRYLSILSIKILRNYMGHIDGDKNLLSILRSCKCRLIFPGFREKQTIDLVRIQFF